jgi:hypothetical protein
MIKFDQRQQAALERFFKEETTWFPEHVTANFVMYILVGISLILLVFPTRAMDGRDDFMSMVVFPLMIYNLGVQVFASKFEGYKDETNQRRSMLELLKYLPVQREQLCLFCIRKMWRICLPLTLVAIVLRSVFSIGFYHRMSLLDFIIPLAGTLLAPILSCFLDVIGKHD